jgi:enamine deaminase RidA (YjgF/YER057c/UK114 family)
MPNTTTSPVTQSLQAFEASLPEPPNPIGSYVTCVQVGNLIYTSGALPFKEGVLLSKGALNENADAASVDLAKAAARQCGLNALSVVKSQLGSLSKVERVVKLTGFVSSGPGFAQHPQVVNGASDLLVEVFGEAGKHARSAVGVSSLPMDATVELEMIVEIKL